MQSEENEKNWPFPDKALAVILHWKQKKQRERSQKSTKHNRHDEMELPAFARLVTEKNKHISPEEIQINELRTKATRNSKVHHLKAHRSGSHPAKKTRKKKSTPFSQAGYAPQNLPTRHYRVRCGECGVERGEGERWLLFGNNEERMNRGARRCPKMNSMKIEEDEDDQRGWRRSRGTSIIENFGWSHNKTNILEKHPKAVNPNFATPAPQTH